MILMCIQKRNGMHYKVRYENFVFAKQSRNKEKMRFYKESKTKNKY